MSLHCYNTRYKLSRIFPLQLCCFVFCDVKFSCFVCSLTVKIGDVHSAVLFCNEDVRLSLDKLFVSLKNYNLSEVVMCARF